jgi:hypothetical protein
MTKVTPKKVRVSCILCGWHGYRARHIDKNLALEETCPHCETCTVYFCDCRRSGYSKAIDGVDV